MKATPSGRSSGNGTGRSSGRKSAQKNNKAYDTPPLTPTLSDEVLFQLQQQQIQLAQLQQHGHLLNFQMSPMLYQKVESAPKIVQDDTTNVLQRLETKEARMDQLSALLEAMKQETAGTTEAMQKTIQENERLQRLNDALTMEVQKINGEADALKQEHAKQLQEIARAVEVEQGEMQRKYEDAVETAKKEHASFQQTLEAEISLISNENLSLKEKLRELNNQCEAWQEQLSASNDKLSALAHEQSITKELHESQLCALNSKIDEIELEKQELGKLLANAFQDLEKSRAALLEANNNAARLSNSLAQNDISWQNTLDKFDKQLIEAKTQREALEQALHATEAALYTERSQKEELNSAMRSELQRYTDELQQIHDANSKSMKQVVSERDDFHRQITELESSMKLVDKQLKQMAQEHQEKIDDVKHALKVKTKEADQLKEAAQTNTREIEALKSGCNILESKLNEAYSAKKQSEEKMVEWVYQLQKLLSGNNNDPTFDINSAFLAIESLVQVSKDNAILLEAFQKSEQDHQDDRSRLTELNNKLQLELKATNDELVGVKQDCSGLAAEIQHLITKSAEDLQQAQSKAEMIINEAEQSKQNIILQTMQLQKAIDSQRSRISQLEEEKRELLQEAETLNKSIEGAYQAKNATLTELNNTKGELTTLRAEYEDLQDAHSHLIDTSASDMDELRSKIKEIDLAYSNARLKWDEESQLAAKTITDYQAQLKSLNDLVLETQSENDTTKKALHELNESVKKLQSELLEATDSCAEWKDKAEALESTGSNVENTLKTELTKSSSQCINLTADNKRLEAALMALQTQFEQLSSDLQIARNEKRSMQKLLDDRDEDLMHAQTELSQSKVEFERLARSKQMIQAELSRASDDLNDNLRQLEVLRREFRSQEKSHSTLEDSLQKEADNMRIELAEAQATNEELQSKITTIQSAANATINDLVVELSHAEELLKAEQASHQKDDELLRTQCRYMEDDIKRKEIEWKDSTNILKRELAVRRENYDNLESKFQKQKESLEMKKVEVDKLTKENEMKQLKVAELERKLAPMANVKESLTQRVAELKHTLDVKSKETNELEERLRDEISRLQKEKRDLESTHMRAKEELDSGNMGRLTVLNQQLVSENKHLKSSLERVKQDLQMSTENVLTLTQRLDALQKASNATISDLNSRLQSYDQQYQTLLHSLSRDLAVEKEKNSELLGQKLQLQKQIRKSQRPTTSDDLMTSRSSVYQPEDTSEVVIAPPKSNTKSMDDAFTKDGLANIPVALLRAQIGLEMYTPDKLSNQFFDNEVPALNLDNLSSAHSLESATRDESTLPQTTRSSPDRSSSLRSKGKLTLKQKDQSNLKLIKKKMGSKPDGGASKMKALDTLPKLG